MAEKYMKTIQFETGGDVYHPLPVVSKGGVVPIAGTAGKLWTSLTETEGMYLTCICKCQNSIVIGDGSGNVYRSVDGKNLSSPIAVSICPINGLCYYNGMLVCATDGAGLYRSSDEGVTWISIDAVTDSYADTPWILNNKWFAGSDNVIFSDDAITWSKLETKDIKPIGYFNGLYIATGCVDEGLKFSTDLSTWTDSNITNGSYWYFCSIDDVAVISAAPIVGSTGNGGSYYSTDGKTWTQSNITSGYYRSIYYADGLLVAGFNNTGLWYSTDGKTWSQSNITSGYFNSVYYANGLWISGSQNSGAYYSTDGKSWTQSNITSKSFKNITSYKDILIALNSDVLCYSEPETNQLESPDNGSILQVVNGEWAMVAVTNAEEVEY